MLKGARNNDRIAFDDEELAREIFVQMIDSLPTIEGWKAHSLDSHFRYYRYDTDQRFKAHVDGSVKKGELKSFVTLLIYLNDGFEGGETQFFSDKDEDGKRIMLHCIKPAAGDLLLFQHRWWHEGCKLESGRKYVLRSDVFYEPMAE